MRDRRLNPETVIGYVLLTGTVAATVLVAGGVAWGWATTGRLGLEYRLQGQNLLQIARQDLADLIHTPTPQSLTTLGFVVLLATPLTRVAASLVYFAAVGNRKYVGFTGFVFTVLLYSVVIR